MDDSDDDSGRVGPGSVLDARYALVRVLGEGGFGVVYEARQLSTGQRVAVKLLRRERPAASRDTGLEIERFRRELEAIARLRHPNIVQLVDQGLTGTGDMFAVLGFIEGESLAEVLQREGALTAAEASHVMGQVLDALGYAHEHGIVHRDLKPANIMLTAGSGRWRHALVVDFGIATLRGPGDAERTQLTGDGQFPGTPAYMAPEQLRAEPIAPGIDLYAWGLTFIEALTGRPAVDGSSVAAVLFKQMSDEAVPIPEPLRGPPLGPILERATAKLTAARYTSARDALRDLDLALHGRADEPTGVAPTLDTSDQRVALSPTTGAVRRLPRRPCDDEPEASACDAAATTAHEIGADFPATQPAPASEAAATATPGPPRARLALGAAALLLVLVAAAGALWLVLRSAPDASATRSSHAREPAPTAPQRAADAPPATDPPAVAIQADVDVVGAQAEPRLWVPPTVRSMALGAGVAARAWSARPRVVDVVAARWTSCALLSDGRVRCWGDGRGAGLGAEVEGEAYSPVDVAGMPALETLLGGPGVVASHERAVICGRDASQLVWCWGDNRFSGMGTGNSVDVLEPRAVLGLSGARHVERASHACALLERGGVVCWGSDDFGQLGDGEPGSASARPTPIAAPEAGELVEPVRDVALLTAVGCAVDGAGALWCWGSHFDGLFGPDVQSPQSRPTRSPAVGALRELAGTQRTWCGVADDGDAGSEVVCWGLMFHGGAAPIAGTAGVTQLVAGGDSLCGLDRSGQVVCWSASGGARQRARVLALPQPARVVTLGAEHGCALLASGEAVWCWGRNTRGQLGDGTAVDRSEPVRVAHLLDAPLPAPRLVPTAVPEHPTPSPAPPADLPRGCVADDVLAVAARRDDAVQDLVVRSSWFLRHAQSRFEVVLSDHQADPEALDEAPRGLQQRVVINLPQGMRAGGLPMPGTYEARNPATSVTLQRGPDESGRTTLKGGFEGDVEIMHADARWICGRVEVSTASGARVSGRFVAARASDPSPY